MRRPVRCMMRVVLVVESIDLTQFEGGEILASPVGLQSLPYEPSL
jgi:hypothetical protein